MNIRVRLYNYRSYLAVAADLRPIVVGGSTTASREAAVVPSPKLAVAADVPVVVVHLKTNNIDIVTNCQKESAFDLPSVILARGGEHFSKYKECDNTFCNVN